MAEREKERGIMDLISDGLGSISRIISASIFPPIAEGTEMVMRSIEDRLIRTEKRILREISSLLIIGFGGMLLVFALLFFLTDSLGWSKAMAFFSVGITAFVAGLLLKVWESDR